jgi:hypothetical protein
MIQRIVSKYTLRAKAKSASHAARSLMFTGISSSLQVELMAVNKASILSREQWDSMAS